MRKDKLLATRLRRQNKSYNEIRRILGVPKSTLSDWFKNDPLSKKTKGILTEQTRLNTERIEKFVATNRSRWEQWREEARQEARTEFSRLSKNYLFVAGLMLYWAEGDGKLKNRCKFTNTDPRMAALYVKFVTEVLQFPRSKLRVSLILYPDLNETECMKFWSKTVNIPRGQFYKTQFIEGRHPTARLSNGIFMVNCGGRQLKEKIMIWIDLLSKTL